MSEHAPFPEKCPHCGSFARYEASKEVVDGEHRYGLTVWECGFSLSRFHDEEFGNVTEQQTPCRRTPR